MESGHEMRSCFLAPAHLANKEDGHTMVRGRASVLLHAWQKEEDKSIKMLGGSSLLLRIWQTRAWRLFYLATRSCLPLSTDEGHCGACVRVYVCARICVAVRVTYEAGDVDRLVAEALKLGTADTLVAAGGDGTLNEAVAAILDAKMRKSAFTHGKYVQMAPDAKMQICAFTHGEYAQMAP
eukprot:1162151-Pelagomonas_calceolata.AAC.5